jgi:hypothetical protein
MREHAGGESRRRSPAKKESPINSVRSVLHQFTSTLECNARSHLPAERESLAPRMVRSGRACKGKSRAFCGPTETGKRRG